MNDDQQMYAILPENFLNNERVEPSDEQSALDGNVSSEAVRERSPQSLESLPCVPMDEDPVVIGRSKQSLFPDLSTELNGAMFPQTTEAVLSTSFLGSTPDYSFLDSAYLANLIPHPVPQNSDCFPSVNRSEFTAGSVELNQTTQRGARSSRSRRKIFSQQEDETRLQELRNKCQESSVRLDGTIKNLNLSEQDMKKYLTSDVRDYVSIRTEIYKLGLRLEQSELYEDALPQKERTRRLSNISAKVSQKENHYIAEGYKLSTNLLVQQYHSLIKLLIGGKVPLPRDDHSDTGAPPPPRDDPVDDSNPPSSNKFFGQNRNSSQKNADSGSAAGPSNGVGGPPNNAWSLSSIWEARSGIHKTTSTPKSSTKASNVVNCSTASSNASTSTASTNESCDSGLSEFPKLSDSLPDTSADSSSDTSSDNDSDSDSDQSDRDIPLDSGISRNSIRSSPIPPGPRSDLTDEENRESSSGVRSDSDLVESNVYVSDKSIPIPRKSETTVADTNNGKNQGGIDSNCLSPSLRNTPTHECIQVSGTRSTLTPIMKALRPSLLPPLLPPLPPSLEPSLFSIPPSRKTNIIRKVRTETKSQEIDQTTRHTYEQILIHLSDSNPRLKSINTDK